MATIGLNDTTGLGSAAETTAASHALMNGTGFTYVAGANEEVFRFGYYSGTAGSNATVEIGLYDVTGGATNAPLVTSGQVTGTAGSSPFTVDVTPVTLTNGNTYCVAWRIVANGNMQRAFTSNACRTSTLTGTSALAANFTNNAGLSQKYAVWAETQATSGTVTGSGALAAQAATMAGTATTFQVVTGSGILIDSTSMFLNLDFVPVDGDKVGIPRDWLGSALTLAVDGTFTITPALPNGTEIPRISFDTSTATWYEDVVTINDSGALTIYATGALVAQSATMSGTAVAGPPINADRPPKGGRVFHRLRAR